MGMLSIIEHGKARVFFFLIIYIYIVCVCVCYFLGENT